MACHWLTRGRQPPLPAGAHPKMLAIEEGLRHSLVRKALGELLTKLFAENDVPLFEAEPRILQNGFHFLVGKERLRR